MLPETAHPAEEPPSAAELRARADRVLGRCDAAMAAVEAGRVPPDEGRRIPYLIAALRELRTQFERAALREAFTEDKEAQIRADERERARAAKVPAQRRGRHASSSPAARALKAVRLIVPPAAIGLGLRVWSAHRIAVPVTTAALAASVATAAVTLPGMQLTPHYGAAAKPPAVVAYSTPPATPPATPSAKARHHHRKAAEPVIAAASPSPSARPSRSPSPSPPPSAGYLDVTETAVTLEPVNPGELSGELDLSAAGGAVDWSASAPGVDLDVSGGILTAGGVQVVTVSVPSGTPAGSATIVLEPGDITVLVSWGTSPS
jgi:hypothetical protein